MRRTNTIAVAAAAVGALLLAGCSSSAGAEAEGGAAKSGSRTLVVDSTFDLKTADPARSYEFTGELLAHNTHQYATTFEKSDLTKAVPQLTTYALSPDNKTLTLKLIGASKFPDGSAVTVDDIVFSYQRVQGIKGSPSFLLDGVSVAKVDNSTLTLTTATPNPALPAILANPSLGIVEAKLVKKNGGTTTPADKAEAFLNKTTAGSGPYQIDTLDISSQITLKRNPNYSGPKPAWDKVVIQNVAPATQKLNVQSGQADIALDISPDDAKTLDAGSTKVIKGLSVFTVYTFFAADQAHGKAVSDPKFVAAARHAINYQKLLNIAGPGSVQPGGVVPVQFPGSLKNDANNTYAPDKAKELLAQSAYKGEEITYLYASDVTVQGLQLQLLAQSIQADLKAAGINVKLDPQPAATYYSTLRSHTVQSALAYWGPDFPDASNYLAFTPGQGVAKSASWNPGAPTANAVAPFVTAAQSAIGDARVTAYQKLQEQLNKVGPIIPLIQPAQSVVTTTSISNLNPSPLWLLDLSQIK